MKLVLKGLISIEKLKICGVVEFEFIEIELILLYSEKLKILLEVWVLS